MCVAAKEFNIQEGCETTKYHGRVGRIIVENNHCRWRARNTKKATEVIFFELISALYSVGQKKVI